MLKFVVLLVACLNFSMVECNNYLSVEIAKVEKDIAVLRGSWARLMRELDGLINDLKTNPSSMRDAMLARKLRNEYYKNQTELKSTVNAKLEDLKNHPTDISAVEPHLYRGTENLFQLVMEFAPKRRSGVTIRSFLLVVIRTETFVNKLIATLDALDSAM
ncbi:hypothetical protein D915_009928 [Fasciola hepatica]|uniref:Uncharacterized protein n=1 Tax=Fasciola hepatica TaxID=6192 RepID=A0A4E0QW99_FASHE|nr:hypothetical protein D915_009928 [Fasciola hepatica]